MKILLVKRMKRDKRIFIEPSNPPKVLLLGNGILQLNNGMRWSELINALGSSDSSISIEAVLDRFPIAEIVRHDNRG